MTRRRSSACELALRLLAQGASVREAARLAGVSPSTVSRALALDGGRQTQKPRREPPAWPRAAPESPAQ